MIHVNETTTPKLVVRETPDLMESVENLDAELKAIIDKLDSLNRKLEAENIELAQRLGLPRPEVHRG